MGNEPLSRTHFVILPESGLDVAAVRAALEGAARVEPLESPRGGCVAIVPESGDLEATCAELRARLRDRADVAPAVVSSGGGPTLSGGLRYPTGLVSARFKSPVSDGEIATFAEAERLDLVGRAQFSRTQALFRPRKGDATYLPQIASRVSKHPAIEAAWLDTESQYHKRDT